MKEEMQPFANIVENGIEKFSMTESETIQFLEENGVQKLTNWHPGQPLLYVLEEHVKADDGPFGHLPKHARPSIARLDSPTALDFNEVSIEENRIVYPLLNETGGAVTFYAIDPITKTVSFVILPKVPSESIRAVDTPFHVRKETLYEANDELFPPSGEYRQPPKSTQTQNE
jgi:hypothetical protein